MEFVCRAKAIFDAISALECKLHFFFRARARLRPLVVIYRLENFYYREENVFTKGEIKKKENEKEMISYEIRVILEREWFFSSFYRITIGM